MVFLLVKKNIVNALLFNLILFIYLIQLSELVIIIFAWSKSICFFEYEAWSNMYALKYAYDYDLSLEFCSAFAQNVFMCY